MRLRWIAVPLGLVAAVTLGGVYQVVGGVHFKGFGQDVDFGSPPPRYALSVWVPTDDFYFVNWRPGTRYAFRDYTRYEGSDDFEAEVRLRRTYEQARNAELRGDTGRAMAIYRGMEARRQGNRAYVRGRIDLFRELRGRSVEGLRAYLKATPNPALPEREMPKRVGPALRPFVEYEWLVGRGWDWKLEKTTRARRLMAFADQYSRSAKAPAALIMAGRSLVEASEVPPTLPELRVANEAFRRILRRYPDSRFVWEARGGLGRIDYLRKWYEAARRHYEWQLRHPMAGRRSVALASIAMCERSLGRKDGMAAAYLRLFDDPAQALSVVRPLRDLLANFSAVDARRLDARIRRDPKLLEIYLAYRSDFTKPTRELLRLGDLPRVTGPSYARLAALALALKDAPRVRRFARRAWAKGDASDSHALATFTMASLERRAGRDRAARRGYRTLLRRWPNCYLAGGARENLALLEERLGNLSAALDQYTALDYELDFAYLIDARMSRSELGRYIRTHPHHPRRAAMIYTLGMRALRERKWEAAEAAFGRLTTRQRRTLTQGNAWKDEGGLQDPLATLRALRDLDRAARRAKGREAKAAALFATGDYYYRHRYLLLYSPSIWRGARSVAVGNAWNQSAAQPADDDALRRHHEEHETYAHAYAFFRRVVKEYPETSVAPKAAYWAASAADHLTDMSHYWRWHGWRTDLIGESVRLMRFAERSKDPTLAAKARKYHRVFRDYYTRQQMAFAKEKGGEERYKGGWE